MNQPGLIDLICWRPETLPEMSARAPWGLAPARTTTRPHGTLFLAQRFARHVSPLTTVVYTHPSDEEMRERLRGLEC